MIHSAPTIAARVASKLAASVSHAAAPKWIKSAAALGVFASVSFAAIAQSGSNIDPMTTGSVGGSAHASSLPRAGAVDTAPASPTLKAGLKALTKRDMDAALAARAKLTPGSLERKVMAWAIAMDGRNVDPQTLNKISQDLAHWPGASRMRGNLERLVIKDADDASIRAAFANSAPESYQATVALAVAHKRAGNNKAARRIIAPIWQGRKLERDEENYILKHLGSVLQKADYRARVEYLLSHKRLRGAERIAGKAGVTRLVKAFAAVERKQRSASQALANVPGFQHSDPTYLLAKARHLRRQGKLSQAAKVLRQADVKKIHPKTADSFWIEQRILASDLLEVNKPKTAYSVVSRNVARSKTKRLDAEFYAGWIALRKVKDSKTAFRHFEKLTQLAGTPLSKSRGHYWMARALRDPAQAQAHYQAAAVHDTTYYGQLAARKLGRSAIDVSRARPTDNVRAQFPRYELVQAIAKLESAGRESLARPIYRHLARRLNDPGELALLAARAERSGDHQLSLQVGKIGFIRGMNVDTLAWPIGAIPKSARTSGAGLPLAYAVARQESTFRVDARSSANALGLLQLLPSTAKRTARNIGVKYSRNKLVTSASYNVQLGTAYLDQQMERFGGSYILTFVAYNAGPLRAQEWIERFGDPRGKSLEFAIDWVEQIPYAETRNYVQRVMENYQVYKTRLKGAKLSTDRDLRRGRRT
ncbi:MAG: lytic transglycosylase domain-containing protein [Hyphomicrobiales bacterium]|nr:lytic transglycosylase domain-containing protein [Hyphomicrobiales bacterium]